MDELIRRLVSDVGDARGGMGGGMGAGMRMIGAGLGMDQVQGTIRQFIAYAREKVGEDEVDDVVGASPGLAQFV
jgi:hypothetical protein